MYGQAQRRKADAEVITDHDERERGMLASANARDAYAQSRPPAQCPDDKRAHVAKLQRAESAGGDACKRSDKSDRAAHRSDVCFERPEVMVVGIRHRPMMKSGNR